MTGFFLNIFGRAREPRIIYQPTYPLRYSTWRVGDPRSNSFYSVLSSIHSSFDENPMRPNSAPGSPQAGSVLAVVLPPDIDSHNTGAVMLDQPAQHSTPFQRTRTSHQNQITGANDAISFLSGYPVAPALPSFGKPLGAAAAPMVQTSTPRGLPSRDFLDSIRPRSASCIEAMLSRTVATAVRNVPPPSGEP